MKVMDNDMKYARLLDENDIQSIINCCQICFPDNQEYSKVISSSTVKPNAYDVVMSDHLKEKHNIRDKYRELIERMTKIQDSLKDEDFQKENGLFYCTQPNCDYSTRWMMCYHNSEGIADHAEWHRTISKAQIPYLYPDPTSSFQDPQVIARYPCPEDSCRFQTPFLHYGAYAAHKSQNHPEFTWKCQIPNCNFSDAFRYKLNGHITLKHARGNHSCDVCGQVYSTEVALQTHMLKHDPELANRFSCDVCGKTFSTEINFKHHRKLNHEKTIECPLCPEKFKRKQNVEAHLIHAHGQERKYKCDVCGAKFIQNHHRQRHIKQFHGDNPTATLTTIRQRGPNRNQNYL
jgi:DNA-directed RNA polymerase subunit RPC12/RpoP